jgi:hypothetical protein
VQLVGFIQFYQFYRNGCQMYTQFNVTDLYETFTTDFDVAVFQDAVWTPGITHFILSHNAQIPSTVLPELREQDS